MNHSDDSSHESEAANTTTFVRARDAAARLLGRIKRRKAAVPPVEERVFRDGQVVARRYRVLGWLGRGGVGQVYEVKDLELGERVALKTLHPILAGSTQALEQFKREVLLARTVTHENVCRLFEFGRHTLEQGGDCLFVTMELLEGETLDSYLRRAGRLVMEEALDIADQVARGLRAAHRRGVIHRDVKGSNVFLCPKSDGTKRVVVTDFGLALDTASEEPGASVPSPSGFQGTPLFMAPEQVRGEEVSTATDVYAWGVLLYHMVTGGWPFVGKTAVSTALKRIDADPVPPSELVADLDRRCEALLLRCLERRPDRRPASADEILAEVAAFSSEAGGAKRVDIRSTLKWLVPLGVAVLLGVGIGWLAPPRPGATKAPGPAEQSATRPAVLVLGFANGTGHPDMDWVATALSQVLASTLAAGSSFLLIDADETERVRSDLLMSGSAGSRAILSQEELARLGRRSGADWVLSGSYRLNDGAAAEPGLVVDLSLGSTRGQEPSWIGTLDAHAESLGDLAVRASTAIRRHFRMESATPGQVEAAKAELPADPRAARAYAEGIAALRRFDARTAIAELQEALAHEGDHALVHAGLASAWEQLGYGRQAKEAAQRAFDHAGSLSREKQLAVEARYRTITHDWKRATELYRALREFFPDDLEYGLGLAGAQNSESNHEGAYSTLAQLRNLPEPWGQDPRIDWTESMVRYHAGEYPQSQELAGRAVEKARDLEAKWLVATALETRAKTYIHTHDPQGAAEMLHEARQIFEEVGDQAGLARALTTLGGQAGRRGDFKKAEAFYSEALEIVQATGNLKEQARARTSLAILYDRFGRLNDGLALKEEVLENYRNRDVRKGVAVTLENLGISLLKMGRLKEARERFTEAAREFGAVGDQIGQAWAPYWEGRVWIDLGELDLARASFRRAIEAAEQRPEGGLGTDATFELARVALAAGDLDAAEQHATFTLEAYQRHQPLVAAESRVLLARVLAQGEDFERAIELTAEALQVFKEAASRHRIVQARSELTTQLLKKAKRGFGDPEALREHCLALAGAESFEYQRIWLRSRVVVARCHDFLATRERSSVLAELGEVVNEAHRLGLFEPRLEAELLRSEILLSAGEHAQAASALAGLRPEVEELGWRPAVRYISVTESAISSSKVEGQ